MSLIASDTLSTSDAVIKSSTGKSFIIVLYWTTTSLARLRPIVSVSNAAVAWKRFACFKVFSVHSSNVVKEGKNGGDRH